jgi:hypothetical protein
MLKIENAAKIGSVSSIAVIFITQAIVIQVVKNLKNYNL